MSAANSPYAISHMAYEIWHILISFFLSEHPACPLNLAIHPKFVANAQQRLRPRARSRFRQFSNPHCAEMIIAWLPKEKILFEADMLDTTYPDHIGQGGEDTAALLEKIQELGLAVERIVPVHGQLGTIDHLRRAVLRDKANK
jgi:hypothetical protein